MPLFPFESSTGNRLWPKGGSLISGLQVPWGAADSGNRACGSRGVQIRCSPLPRKPLTRTFDFCLSTSIPVLTTSTCVVAWPQGDQLLGGGPWHKANLPATHWLSLPFFSPEGAWPLSQSKKKKRCCFSATFAFDLCAFGTRAEYIIHSALPVAKRRWGNRRTNTHAARGL